MTTRCSLSLVILTTVFSLTSATRSLAAPPPGKGKNQLKLSITVEPSSIAEGEQAVGKVSHDNSDLSSSVVVTLSSSDTGEATATNSDTGGATVTIPAGSASATFDVTAIDDSVTDGDQSVTITVSADGYQSGSANLTITDPAASPEVEFTIEEIPVPGNGTVWINGVTNSSFVYGWFTDTVDGVTVYRSGWIYDQFNGSFYDLNQEASLLSQVESLFGPDAGLDSVVGMNSRGDMVVYVEDSSGIRKGYVIDTSLDGQFSPDPADWNVQALPDFGSDFTYGRRINEIGDVLGVYKRADGTSDAYLYNPWLGTPDTPLGVNLENTDVELNNLAEVAGIFDGGTAFLFDPTNSDWQWFTDAEYLNIRGLNDDGTFVGDAYTIETYAGGKKQRRGNRAAFRHAGSFEPLGAGLAKGVNTSGDVALDISEPTILHTGFAPDFAEQTLTLADLITADDPLKSTFVSHSPEVFAINDRDATGYSQAVVRLYDVSDGNGATRSNVVVILTPVVP